MAAVGVRVEVRGWHGVCVWGWGLAEGGRVVCVGLDGVEVGVFVDSAAEVQSGAARVLCIAPSGPSAGGKAWVWFTPPFSLSLSGTPQGVSESAIRNPSQSKGRSRTQQTTARKVEKVEKVDRVEKRKVQRRKKKKVATQRSPPGAPPSS